MKLIVATAVVMSSVAVILAQPPRSGVEMVVKVEAQRLAGQDVSEQTLRIIESELTPGGVEVRYITDGESVRSTLSGRMFGFDDGTVRLAPRGSSDLQVLNPKDRTYHLSPQDARLFAGRKREFEFQRSGKVRTILDQKTYEVTGRIRVDVPPFPGASVQAVPEVRAEFANWCASTPKVPAPMAKMIDMAQAFVGKGDPRFAEYQQACPLALHSAVKLSLFPGFELVFATQSIRRLPQVPPSTFQLPEGYRQVAKDGTEP